MTRRTFFSRLAAGVASLLGVWAAKAEQGYVWIIPGKDGQPRERWVLPKKFTQADATGREVDLPIIDLTVQQVVVSNTSQERFWVRFCKDGYADFEEIKPGESRAFAYAMIPVRERPA